MSWRQLVLDWEKADRDERALRDHCRLCGLASADASVLAAINRNGTRVRDGQVSRSELVAPMRRLAELADISAGAVHKAKCRLTRRTPELMRHYPDTRAWVVSWVRVWALQPLPTPGELWEADEGPPNGTGSVSAHGRSRPPQERKIDTYQPIPTTNTNQPERLEVTLPWSVDTQVAALHEAQVDGLARRIVDRLKPCELRHRVPVGQLLDAGIARQIAAGICDDPDSGTAEEVERVLSSIGRKAEFIDTPAAYLVACAKRRGWYTPRPNPERIAR